MHTITIANRKGGVGKTSTSLAVAQGLQLQGKKTLMIDLDPQGNLTFSCLNLDGNVTIQDMLENKEDSSLSPNTCKYRTFSLDVITTNDELNNIVDELEPYSLQETLKHFSNAYDYCIIDAPPALNMLTMNALTASDSVIIPVLADAYSMQAVSQLMELVEVIQSNTNSHLKVMGILYNFYNPRTSLGQQCEESFSELAGKHNTTIFNTKIHRCQDIANCATSGYSVYEYKPNGRAAIMYRSLVDEIIERAY